MELRKLNTLRGIAALIVLIGHYSNEFNFLSNVLGGQSGHIGVMLFFLLSSFLITYKYIEKPPTKEAIFNYLISRFARVLPLYLIVILISFIAHLYLPSAIHDYVYHITNIKELLEHMLFLRGTSVLWTIAPEIYFYLTFVIIWILFSCIKLKIIEINNIIISITIIIVISISIFIIIIFLTLRQGNNGVINLFGLTIQPHIRVFSYFFMGVIIGCLYSSWKNKILPCSHYNVLVLLLIPFLFPNIYVYFTDFKIELWKNIWIFTIISSIFFIIIFMIPVNNKFLETNLGDFIGKISYSIYILHYPLLKIIKEFEIINSYNRFLLYLIVVIIFSYGSYILLELPLKNYFKNYLMINNLTREGKKYCV